MARITLQRALGRAVTSPLAVGVAGLADWALLLARWRWAVARGRRPPF